VGQDKEKVFIDAIGHGRNGVMSIWTLIGQNLGCNLNLTVKYPASQLGKTPSFYRDRRASNFDQKNEKFESDRSHLDSSRKQDTYT